MITKSEITPLVPNPAGPHADPLRLLLDRGPASAYVELEALLRDPSRYEFYIQFRESLQSAAELTPEELGEAVAEIAGSGLVVASGRLNDKIDPMTLLAILRSDESLNYLQASVLASESEHWKEPIPESTLRDDTYTLSHVAAVARNFVATALDAFRAHGRPLALATIVIVVCGLFIYGQSQVHARTVRELREMIHGAQAKIEDLLRKLSETGAGSGVLPSSKTSFEDEFERGRRFQPRTYENEHKLGLVFYPFIGPPYYAAVRAQWDGDHSQWIYRAGRVPLEPEVFLDFTDLAPESGEKRFTLILEFHTTEESMQQIDEIGPMILKRIPLIISSKGVRIASGGDQSAVTASISAPTEGQEVDERFVLEVTLQRPETGSSVDLMRMVQILVRPLDGPESWRDKYYVVPFRSRVDRLSTDGEKQTLAISLSGVLQTFPPDQRPTQLEVLVVDVPFQFDGWTVGKNVVNFDLPETKDMVRERVVVNLRPSDDQP